MIKESVLLLKSQKGDGASDKYEELLKTNSFKVSQVKTLKFEFKNSFELCHKLQQPNDYAGIIFSSPRCVQAVHLASQNQESLLRNWTTKYNYVVGEATYRDALGKLALDCQGKATGNSGNLSKLILESKDYYSKPFLFPHGNISTDTLSIELGKEGIALEEVIVYDSISNPNIEKEIADVTNELMSIPEYIVFFSPSGLHSSLECLRKIPNFNSTKLIAIGPVTEAAMKAENLTVSAVTRNPTPEDVLCVINRMKKHR